MKAALFYILLGLHLVGCSKDDDGNTTPVVQPSCSESAVISSELYANASTDPLTIEGLELDGDCLTITYSASGCDGTTWDVELIDSQVIMFSLPPQRRLRLTLHNTELCAVYITQEVTYDVSNLQSSGGEILLKVNNGALNAVSILYTY